MGACRRAQASPGVVTLWHPWTGRNKAEHDAVIERFCAIHPQVVVESSYVPAEFLRQRWLAGLHSGLLPDLCLINSSWLRAPTTESQVANLQALAKADDLRLQERLVSRDYERCLRGDRLLALPVSSASGGTMLFINRGVLSAAGMSTVPLLRNWDDFIALSRLLVDRLNHAGGPLQVLAWDPFSYLGQQFLVAFALGAGVPLISRDGSKSLMDQTAVVRILEAIDAYEETVYANYGGRIGILRWRERVGEIDPAAINSPFRTGEQAFALTGSWLAGVMNNAKPRPDFDVMPIPGLERLHGGIAAHGWVYSMRSKPRDADASWALLKYLTVDAEGNGRMAVNSLRPSPIRSVNDSDAYSSMGRIWDSMRQSMSLDMPYPYSVDSDLLRIFMKEYPFRRLRGESIEVILADFHNRLQANLDVFAQETLR